MGYGKKNDKLPSGFRKTPQALKQRGPKPETLTGRESVTQGVTWKADQWAYIEWLATPAINREPFTETALAEVIGVTTATFRNWRKLPNFTTEVRAIARSYMEKDLPDIYYALVDQAKLGSFPHIKLALELMGEYTEHNDVTSGGKPFPVQVYDYAAVLAQITGGPSRDNSTSGPD